MKRFSSELCAGVVRWATIGVVTGAAVLSGCRGVESVERTRPADTTTTRVCTVEGLIVTPNSASLNVGQTLQLSAASPCPGTRPTVFIFASSAPSVAAVDSRSGVVTAVAPGTAIIIVSDSAVPAAKQGTSAITVMPILKGLTIRSISDTAGNPARLDSIAGTVVVVLNIEAGTSFLKQADLFLDCGSGDLAAASTNPSTGTPGSLVTMNVNTAARDSSGALRYPNGACTLKVRLTSTDGNVFWGNSVSLVLRN